MKVFISVDMEGITGIVDISEVGRDAIDYQKGRDLMVADVNAAIEGILDYEQAEIVVSDAHAGMINIEPEKLNKAAVLVRGTPKPLSQMAGIDAEFDAAFFIGYHSMKGAYKGVLSHTFSGKTVESLTINGMEVGETKMNAAIAGCHGVPLVFVSGDQAVALETESLNSEIETVIVKEAISRTAAKCLHPVKARQLIREAASKALEKREVIQPFVFESPVTFDVRYTNARMADAVEFMPSAERIDGKTIRFVQDDYLKAYGAFRASVFIALFVNQ